MIILLVVCIIGTIAGILMVDKAEEIGMAITIVFSICLLSVIIAWPVIYLDFKTKIAQYHVMKKTVDGMRADGIDLMDAAINQKIIEANMIMAAAKYWNGTILERVVPDEFENLPYLK